MAGMRAQGKLSRAQFSNWLCYDLTDACAVKPPPLPKDRPAGQPFQVIDPQEAQMQKMMAGMKVQQRSLTPRNFPDARGKYPSC